MRLGQLPEGVHYVGESLRGYLLTGQGKPNAAGTARTASEVVLVDRAGTRKATGGDADPDASPKAKAKGTP